MAYLKKQKIIIPTRGSIQDIGPTISHKTKIVELYLKGYEYTDIERQTRHTGQSIKRYIIGFSKVVMLHSKGYTPNQIRELTNSTEKVVKEFLEMYQKYGEISKERMEQLLSTIAGKIIGSAIKSLLNSEYQFLGGDKVQEMFVNDVMKLFKEYNRDVWNLEPGQTMWFAVCADEKQSYGKTLEKTIILAWYQSGLKSPCT